MPKKSIIRTPRGQIFQVKLKSGRVTCALRWNPDFGAQRMAQFQTVQAYVDNAVLLYCTPYIPMRTGMLMRSGELGTVVGSGEVCYVAPYAHRLYYGTHFNFNHTAHPNAGALWFERMKIDRKGDILRGAAAKAGGTAHE